MSKIVYLFGAGASAGSLPVVNNMNERIGSLVHRLSEEDLILSDDQTFTGIEVGSFQSKREHQLTIIEGLKELESACNKHYSIDTYAKKLWIRNDLNGLKKLKALLSLFFTIEQIRNPPDPRYDFFLASLLKSLNGFPDNIRILSWNYDSQFEYAYSEFSNNTDVANIKKELNIYEKNMPITNYKENDFCIFKLNGSTDFCIKANPEPVPFYFSSKTDNKFDKNTVAYITRAYVSGLYSSAIDSLFSFAWEEPNSEFIQGIIHHTFNAEVLVVIGYSFPYFNRTIDRMIIQRMKNLEKVYIQSPDAHDIIERFHSITNDINPKNVIPKLHKDYFYLPNEL
ncbi:MAG TPA: hypothetical protein VMV47_11390 [Bacteroidales bacterium]|nr:hypothetical protein [Bacteroidales bacterium]HUX96323.1 hypothetical protein [Bacteroidales bacterium]